MKKDNNSTICTKEEKGRNSRLLRNFAFAFTAYDVQAILELLHPEGIFFGKCSKEKAAGVFYAYFFASDGIHEKYFITLNKGWSISPNPGADVLEIRCSDGTDLGKDGVRKKFGEPEDKELGERVFRFCFEFKEGKIVSIRVPRLFMPDDDEMLRRN